MSYGAYLRELLRPLRIYGLEGTANGGELEAQGKALDGVEAAMEEVQRAVSYTHLTLPTKRIV